MHRATKVFDTSGIGRRGDPKHRREVTEPGVTTRPEVPVPAHGLARLHGQVQPLDGVRSLCVRPLEIGDINTRRHVAGERTIPVEARNSALEHPPVLIVVAPQSVLRPVRRSAVEGLCEGRKSRLQILGVHAFGPAVAKLGIQGSTSEGQPRFVDVVAESVGARHPDRRGSGIRRQSEQIVAFEQSVNSRTSEHLGQQRIAVRRTLHTATSYPTRRLERRLYHSRRSRFHKSVGPIAGRTTSTAAFRYSSVRPSRRTSRSPATASTRRATTSLAAMRGRKAGH